MGQKKFVDCYLLYGSQCKYSRKKENEMIMICAIDFVIKFRLERKFR